MSVRLRRALRTSLSSAVALAWSFPAFAAPGQVWVYPFEQSAPATDVAVRIGTRPEQSGGAQAAVGATLAAGHHEIVLSRDGVTLATFPITIADDEQLQVSVSLFADRAPVYTLASSVHGRRTVDLGAAPALGPKTPVAHSQDDGVPAVAPPPSDGEETELEGVSVESALLPSNDRATYVELERASAQVEDALSAEDIARAGDSDAASALRRVTGLSLVDRRFVYVRGLGERYSSVLLNGAQIPSPDPTRRVVPLDLFPADVLDGVLVQKTWSADLPGEFGGGTIQLRTRGTPDDFLLRAQGTLGYVDGTTGEDGLRSRGGGRDWLGRDDGFRSAPSGLFARPLPPSGSSELRALGANLAARGFGIGRKQVGPDTGAAFGVGDALEFADDVRVGFIGAGRYAQEWELRDEQRAEFAVLGDGTLVPQQQFRREKTERNLDGSLFFGLGAQFGNAHRLQANALLLRQTQGEDRIDEGLRASGNVEQAFTSEWIENQLVTRQLGGEHRFEGFGQMQLDWRLSHSSAERDVPLARSHVYSEREPGEFAYATSFPPQIRFETLDDTADELQAAVSWPFAWGDTQSLTLRAGGSTLDRERRSDIHRFAFRNLVSIPGTPTPIDTLLNPGAIARGEFELVATGRATDFYTAEQSLDAAFVSADLYWADWRANLGLRREDNRQRVVTVDPFQPGALPLVGAIDETDVLPAAALTWLHSESAQLRFAYTQTLSRPEFRELSSAPFTDPVLDLTVIGNPQLLQAGIDSLDLRWEYYFSPLESVSVALFDKRFEHPIELVRTPASGDLLELRNAESARNRGIELEIYRGLGFVDADATPDWLRGMLPWHELYVGANYAWIDSDVALGASTGIQTSSERPLQGQSPYVANLTLSWLPDDGRSEATLLYNVAGARISKVGESGVPDEYEQPLHQLDFSAARALPWDGWKLKLRLRNLLDPKVEFHQGDEVSRSYRKGREIALSLEWTF